MSGPYLSQQREHQAKRFIACAVQCDQILAGERYDRLAEAAERAKRPLECRLSLRQRQDACRRTRRRRFSKRSSARATGSTLRATTKSRPCDLTQNPPPLVFQNAEHLFYPSSQ